MRPRFEDLNDAEREWMAACVGSAGQLVAAYSTADAGRTLDAEALDRTWAAYLATGDTDGDRINGFINSIGFAFGQLLVEAAGFGWVVATDKHGTEMALLALPGRGDVLVYPLNMVAKRWHSRETGFLVHLFAAIVQQVRDVEANWQDLPPYFRKSQDAETETSPSTDGGR